MDRRQVIATTVIALTPSFAGCLSDQPDEPVASPALVEIQNNTGEGIDVDVTATKDGSQVHDGQYSISGIQTADHREIGEQPVIDGVQIVEDWMASPAEFEFTFAVPEVGLETTFSSADSIGSHKHARQSALEDECYFLRVAVGGEGDPLTARAHAVPAEIVALAIVYDHEIFDREHAGDCA